MHIPPIENNNKPIVDANDSRVPLNYFNIVKLKKNLLKIGSIIQKNTQWSRNSGHA